MLPQKDQFFLFFCENSLKNSSISEFCKRLYNLKLSESDRDGKHICYKYIPNTNLLSCEFTYEGKSICKRTFYHYDDCARGWTKEQITKAITRGHSYNAINMINKSNSATRYVHPATGQSIVINNTTKEILHIGGPGFKY